MPWLRSHATWVLIGLLAPLLIILIDKLLFTIYPYQQPFEGSTFTSLSFHIGLMEVIPHPRILLLQMELEPVLQTQRLLESLDGSHAVFSPLSSTTAISTATGTVS